MTYKEYNGWTNYETWLVKLWMDNDQGSYHSFGEMAQECYDTDGEDAASSLADLVKEAHEEIINEQTPSNGFIADLIGAAMSEVNWREIAESLLNEVDKPEPEEQETEDTAA